MVVASGQPIPMGSVPRSPKAAPSTGTSDRPSLHRSERSSPVKNRKREICTSGSVRGEGGNILTYSATKSREVEPRRLQRALWGFCRNVGGNDRRAKAQCNGQVGVVGVFAGFLTVAGLCARGLEGVAAS